MKNSFLKEFNEREYFNQCTNLESLSGLMDKKKIRAYIGFDCTAQSLHVGSLLQIMCLRLLQKHGHQPIILLGGGTTRIGDPSGKEETRKILTEKEIQLLELLTSTTDATSKNSILEKVWQYSSEADTHTVETHIYRLRKKVKDKFCLLYTSPSPRDGLLSRMPSSA